MTPLYHLLIPSRSRRQLGAFVVLSAFLVVAGMMPGLPLDAEIPEARDQGVPLTGAIAPDAVRFVFQGKLEESGKPAQRAYDFVFRLFTRGDGGLQVGPSLSVDDLAVLDGSFAVDLDFGAARPPGGELWLEVAVRDDDLSESFTALTPRQRLTGTPYALLVQGGDWSLIGVPVGDLPMSAELFRSAAERSAAAAADDDDGALVPDVARSVSFNGLDHTITASTVAGQSYSRQIRIGFSDTPTPNPANFSDIRVGVGTLTPQATLHVNQPNVPHNGEAARITFRNLNDQQNATGLRVVESQSKTTRGLHQGIATMTSISAGGQAGQSSASLSESSGFAAQGVLLGVAGRSTPNQLDNISTTNTSLGLGGRFVGQPSSPLFLSGTGRYFVGGAYGEVAGQINGNPGGGAVAGIIGIDNSTGSADSWAGYFQGRGHFAGNVGIGTKAPTALLDVAGTARVRTLTGGPSQVLVTAENNGTLHSIPFPGNVNQVLRGNGTFGPVQATPDNDWLGAGTGQMFAGFTGDRVAIGTTGSTAKFVVASNQESPAALFQLSPPANHPFPIGLLVSVSGTATGNGFGAIFQSSANNPSVNNIGLRAEANSPGNINRAMEATASGATLRNTGLETKVSGNATFNIGIRAEADGGQQAYGIFAVAQNGAFNRAGSFQGDIEVTGTIHNPSDRRLKRDIQDLEGALEILNALRPRSFVYRRDENPGLILPEGRHLGLIAQELEMILPELVSESMDPAAEGKADTAARTYKSVSYLELIPILVRGLQEQQTLLSGQEARIRQLEAEKAATSSQLATLSRRLTALESAQGAALP